MGNFTYLGPVGRTRRRGEGIPPRPLEQEAEVAIPMRYWGRPDAVIARVVGESMCPTMLDNDHLMVITSILPLHHDVVVVPFADRRLPGVEMAVAR